MQVARAEHEPVDRRRALDGDVGAALFGAADVARRADGTVELPAGGAGVRVWELT